MDFPELPDTSLTECDVTTYTKIRRPASGERDRTKIAYDRKSPPGTIYHRKKSVRELFTTD